MIEKDIGYLFVFLLAECQLITRGVVLVLIFA